MNWLLDILDSVKWKIQDAVWAIQDKITLAKELKQIDAQWDKIEEVEEIEAKPKKKKAKKKSAKKSV
jgi:hypothetical protein